MKEKPFLLIFATTLFFLITVLLIGCAKEEEGKITVVKKPGDTLVTYTYVVVGESGAIWRTQELTSSSWRDLSGDTNSLTNGRFVNSVIFAKSKFYAVGGKFPTADSGFIIASSDGLTWSDNAGALTSARLRDIIYADNKFIAIADDSGTPRQIHSSTDGSSWSTYANTLNGANQTNYNQKGIAFGGGRFAIGGGFGVHSETLWSSDGGTTWTVSSPSTSNTYINDIAFGEGKFIAVSRNGAIFSSPNAMNWTDITTDTDDFLGVTYGGGAFMIVGEKGSVWKSDDGVSWTDRSDGSTDLYGVTYNNDRYIAVGDSGKVIWSTDGSTWNDASIPGAGLLLKIAVGVVE